MIEMPQPSVQMSDFLNESEIRKVHRIYGSLKDTGRCATQISTEIIEPNIARINLKLGQENDPKYLAYLCEYEMMRTNE